MIDKVQKIREEVERLMYGYNLEADIASCENAEAEKLADIKYQLCKKLLDYIDEVQKEPVSKQKLSNSFNIGKDCKGESVSEDLDKAAKNYAFTMSEEDEVSKYYAFLAGAKWQKEKDQSIIELAKDHAILAGMEKMREKMMKDAVDAKIGSFVNGIIYDANFNIDSDLKDDDKVKVIVIKED